MVSELLVSPAAAPLRGSVPVPADAALGVIALGVAALAHGTSRLVFPAVPEPVRALASALERCGVAVRADARGLEVDGTGLQGLAAPAEALDARGAPLAASVLAGLLVSRPFESVLFVDEVWAEDVLPPLEQAHGVRGHGVVSEPAEGGGRVVRFLPATERPSGGALRLGGARPWAKVALLLGALRAAGPTQLQETVVSPDHCERLLHHLRIPVETSGPTVTLHPPRDPRALAAFEQPTVGDPSAAAYLLAAAALVPESHVTVRGVGLNPTRSAFLEGLRALGVQVGITPGAAALAEPLGEITVFGRGARGGSVRGGVVAGEVGARLADDFVPLALLSAEAEGPVELGDLLGGGTVTLGAVARDIPRVVGVLRAYGLPAVAGAAGLAVDTPPGRLQATRITTGGDHRLALAATVLALRADGPSYIDDVGCLMNFFPRWVGTLRALGAALEVRS